MDQSKLNAHPPHALETKHFNWILVHVLLHKKLPHKHQIKIPCVGLMLLLFSLDLARKIWNEKYSTNILDSCIEYSFTALYLIILNFFVQNFTDGNGIPQEFRPELYQKYLPMIKEAG